MLRALFFAPLLFILVLFALSNPKPVQLGLWPTDLTVDLPLSITILLAMSVAFVLGALLLWLSAVSARLRARRAEHAVKMLEAQVVELKARVSKHNSTAVTALPPPA
jgi:uncharacterized integral membrane protein